jgi:hypothetical protein
MNDRKRLSRIVLSEDHFSFKPWELPNSLRRLGDEIFAPQRQPVRVRKADIAPLVTFTFKYRSLGVLLPAGQRVGVFINAFVLF